MVRAQGCEKIYWTCEKITMKQIQILLIINIGLLALTFGVGFSLGLQHANVKVTLESNQPNLSLKQTNFRMRENTLNKLCALVYLDSKYGPICFCKIETDK